jgi:hypothetical protein
VLLPGVTVLARQVAGSREAAETRLYETLAAAARLVDAQLPRQLAELLQVPGGDAGLGAGAGAAPDNFNPSRDV